MLRRSVIISLAAALSCSAVFAENAKEMELNKVSMQLQAEKWIETQTALVDISVDAAVNDQDMLKLQSAIMQNLKNLSTSAEWHVTSLNRQQDRTGLETVAINAQARLSQADLAGIQAKVKKLSKPGETYKVANIAFTPSEDEIKQTNSALREKIYQQANKELATLNSNYSKQQFFMHQINFMPSPVVMAQARMMMSRAAGMEVASQQMSVDNKSKMMANVVFAAKIPNGN